MTAPKSMRRQMTPGSTYRKPTASFRGLPKMNTATPGRAGKMLTNAAKSGTIKPLKPLKPVKPPGR